MVIADLIFSIFVVNILLKLVFTSFNTCPASLSILVISSFQNETNVFGSNSLLSYFPKRGIKSKTYLPSKGVSVWVCKLEPVKSIQYLSKGVVSSDL